MPYSNTLPDVREALSDALKTLIVNDITNLNAALAAGSLTPMSLVAAQIVLGDSQHFTRSRISIVGGGEADARDMETEMYVAPLRDTSGYKLKLSTNIYVYIHPDEMTSDNPEPEVHMARIERARARICGHIRRRILNAPENVTITLGSREYSAAPNYDTIDAGYVRDVYMGLTPKGFGTYIEVPTAHLVHVAEIA